MILALKPSNVTTQGLTQPPETTAICLDQKCVFFHLSTFLFSLNVFLVVGWLASSLWLPSVFVVIFYTLFQNQQVSFFLEIANTLRTNTSLIYHGPITCATRHHYHAPPYTINKTNVAVEAQHFSSEATLFTRGATSPANWCWLNGTWNPMNPMNQPMPYRYTKNHSGNEKTNIFFGRFWV